MAGKAAVRVVTSVVVAASMALGAQAAQAATNRYAAPSPQGSGDCSTPADACTIGTAVALSVSGDTVDVRADLGDYDLGTGTIAPGSSTAVSFVGISGTPRLIANGSAPTLELQAASSSARNLYVENDGDGDALSAGLVGGPGSISLDRLYVKTTGAPSHTCLIEGGVTLTNSVCWQSNSAATSDGILLEGTNTLRNDVSWVTGSGAAVDCGSFYFECDGTVVNTIARATAAGGSDLETFGGPFDTTLTVRHSNFGTAVSKGNTAKDHFDIDATNQRAAPQLVNPSAGNFRELATSPTINAGVTSPANGATDLDGKPRTVNGKTDIGAYERGTPLPPRPHGTKITKAKIRKRRATFRFTASGTVKGFRCALARRKKGKHPKLVFRRCKSPKTYKHLKRHARYLFEVRAFNAAGVDRKPARKRFRA
jgi:hypothetical protein